MESQYIILVELDRCIGCHGGCQVACKTEHSISLGPSRSKMYSMGPTGKYPDIEMYFMPVMCQQCENPSGTEVCPTGACYKSGDDGVVYIDRDMCIGCQSCMKSCPYQCIIFNKELNVSDKCDICSGRRADGLPPACVRNCAGGALHYGDINDPDSEVSVLIRENEGHVYTLADPNGNNPQARYMLRDFRWIEELPFIYAGKMRGEI